MAEFTLDAPLQPSDHSKDGGGLCQRFTAAAAISPRNHRRNFGDLIETAHFLRSCSLCDRRLVPGRDIYMYKYFPNLSLSLNYLSTYTLN